MNATTLRTLVASTAIATALAFSTFEAAAQGATINATPVDSDTLLYLSEMVGLKEGTQFCHLPMVPV